MSKARILRDCTAFNHQWIVVFAHLIPEEIFTKALDDFWGKASDAKGCKLTRDELVLKIGSEDCNLKVFLIDTDDQPNADLNFSIINTPVALPMPAPVGKIKVTYSLDLLKAVLTICSLDSIIFYKATISGSKKVIFEVVSGGKSVYYGDLSDTAPFIRLVKKYQKDNDM